MGETLEQKKRRLYTSMSHEDLVEEILKRDEQDDKTSMCSIAKSAISDELIKAMQKTLLKKIEDPKIVDEIVLHKTSWGTTEPSDVLKNIFARANTDGLVKEFQDGLCETLKTKYKEICERVMYQVFLNGLTDNNIFRSAVDEVISNREY
jgi:hypothetical protein